jgi:hypothetical protein
MQGLVSGVRAAAGNGLMSVNLDKLGPIGQVWIFKVHFKDVGKFTKAFAKLMKSFSPPGAIVTGQFTQGNSDGESMFIYGTSNDLAEAFSGGPSTKKEMEAV